jgi:trimeric autotransporter adhesin
MTHFSKTALILSLGAATCRAQPCSPYWAGPPKATDNVGVKALAAFDDGTGNALYAAGYFYDLVGTWVQRDSVWRWRNGSWEPVGPGQLIGAGRRLLVLDDGTGKKLYTEGHAGSPAVWWFKRWNGTSWVDGPAGFWTHNPFPQANQRPRYTGQFGSGFATFGYEVPGVSSGSWYIIQWVSGNWQHLGGPIGTASEPHFEIYDHGAGSRLYVGGNYNTISGVQAHGIAAWDGQQWHSLATTSEFRPGLIRDLCVFDDGSGPALYLGGDRSNAPNIFNECIVRWNGSQWSSVGGGITSVPGSFGTQVNQMAVFDDGSGPALFAAGLFDHAGGVPARGIAKWNGKTWAAVGGGLSGFVETMAVHQDVRGPSLFIGGNVDVFNGAYSQSLGQYVGCPNCYANCDLSTTAPTLNIADFTCFLRHFAANDPYANCDNSTAAPAINIADFQCFLQRFAAGCP